MSIEEIKKVIIDRGYIGYEEILLSSLENKDREIGELNGSLEALGVDLDAQKKFTDKLESSLEKAQKHRDIFADMVEKRDKQLEELKVDLEKEKQKVVIWEKEVEAQRERVKEFEEENKTHLESIKRWRIEYHRIFSSLEKEKEENERLNRVYNLELERVNKAENQHFRALLELQKEKERADRWESDWNKLNEHMKIKLDELIKTEERVKELEAQIYAPNPLGHRLKYCKEHRTICMEYNGKLACCLKANLQKLVERIEDIKLLVNEGWSKIILIGAIDKVLEEASK